MYFRQTRVMTAMALRITHNATSIIDTPTLTAANSMLVQPRRSTIDGRISSLEGRSRKCMASIVAKVHERMTRNFEKLMLRMEQSMARNPEEHKFLEMEQRMTRNFGELMARMEEHVTREIEKGMASIKADLAAIEARLAKIEEQVADLERRLVLLEMLAQAECRRIILSSMLCIWDKSIAEARPLVPSLIGRNSVPLISSAPSEAHAIWPAVIAERAFSEALRSSDYYSSTYMSADVLKVAIENVDGRVPRVLVQLARLCFKEIIGVAWDEVGTVSKERRITEVAR